MKDDALYALPSFKRHRMCFAKKVKEDSIRRDKYSALGRARTAHVFVEYQVAKLPMPVPIIVN